jgi:hypothetical protein
MNNIPPEVPDQPAQPWADHVILGLKNPKFFKRKVGDLSLAELQAIESQWLPKVRQVWDHVTALQRADAEAFEAAIAYHGVARTKTDPEIIHPTFRYIPPEVRAQLKRFSASTGGFVPDAIRKTARYYYPARYDLNDETAGWQWGEDGECEIDVWDIEESDCCDPAGYIQLCPLEDGGYELIFRIDLEWPEDFDPEDLVFPTVQEAKAFLGTLPGSRYTCNPRPVHEQAWLSVDHTSRSRDINFAF